MKELLASEEGRYTTLFKSLLTAMRPLMGEAGARERQGTGDDDTVDSV